jgi:hypothetical protein
MAHFAKLDENNVVTEVIVVGNKDTSDTMPTSVKTMLASALHIMHRLMHLYHQNHLTLGF